MRESAIELKLAADSEVRIDVDDGAATPAPQTMTGWGLLFILRAVTRQGNGTALVTKTTGGGITIGNGAGTNDRATVTIADTDLPATITPGRGYHATLWRTDAGSDVPLWHGTVTLDAVAAQP